MYVSQGWRLICLCFTLWRQMYDLPGWRRMCFIYMTSHVCFTWMTGQFRFSCFRRPLAEARLVPQWCLKCKKDWKGFYSLTEMVNKKCYFKYVDRKERTEKSWLHDRNYIAEKEQLSWHEDMKKNDWRVISDITWLNQHKWLLKLFYLN